LIGRLLHPYFPINKNLWTSSYVLFTAGAALLVLALCYWLVDLRGWRRWATPLLVFGMNAILAFALSTLIAEISGDFQFHCPDGRLRTLHDWFYEKYFVPHASSANASLAFAGFFVFLIFVLLLPLYRKKIFVRI
jgi:predicted acyltransferase